MSNPRPAMFWSESSCGAARCELCPQGCVIPENASGLCGVRENRGGTLYAAGYGQISAAALDPVEKKPLYMFHPGKRVLSIGGFGCNLRCPFCQNSDISVEYGARRADAEYLSPDELLRLAQRTVPDGNIGAAYTYNEPLTGFEYSLDCARLIRGAGLMNIVVTNGYINAGPLEELLPYIDAMNIDLKCFSEGFYKKLGGALYAVMETIEKARRRCHVEVTTLIIPGENDSPDEIAELSGWLASLSPDIPLHLTRFFPRYRYSDRTPAPREALLTLREIAQKRLRNVFTGNMR